MIKVDMGEIKQFERDLRKFAHLAFPFATKQTVNKSAIVAQKNARQNIRIGMINRNKFTERSVQVDLTNHLNVNTQKAVVGSIADYMKTQEFGGIKTDPTLPTSYSAGQNLKSKPRLRLPRKPNKLTNINLRKGGKKGSNKKQRNLIAIRTAAKSGRKFVFLKLARTEGIFKVIGGKRTTKLRMIYNTGEILVNIPRNPWLKPAVDKVPVDEIYLQALIFQLRRQKLFDY